MASPKRRTSVRRKNQRRAHDFLTAVPGTECGQCGALRRPHRVCGSCGFYDGKQVIAVSED